MSERRKLTRRQFLRGMGLAATAAVAGCVPEGVLPVATPTEREVEPGSTPIPTPTSTPKIEFTPVATAEATVEAIKVSINLNPSFAIDGPMGAGGPEGLSPQQLESAQRQWEDWKPYVEEMVKQKYVSSVVNEENPTGLEMRVVSNGDEVVLYAKRDGSVVFPMGSELTDNGLTLPEMKDDWKVANVTVLSPSEGGRVYWDVNKNTFVRADSQGSVTESWSSEGRWETIQLVEVPVGADQNVWNKAIVVGGAEGAEWSNEFDTVVWKEQGEIKTLFEVTTGRVMTYSRSGQLVVLCDKESYPYTINIDGSDQQTANSLLAYWANWRQEYYGVPEGGTGDVEQLGNAKYFKLVWLPSSEFNSDPNNPQWPSGSFATVKVDGYSDGYTINAYMDKNGVINLIYYTASGMKQTSNAANVIAFALANGVFKPGYQLPSYEDYHFFAGILKDYSSRLEWHMELSR